MTKRPIIGVTMGDPCGNGPEITIKALSDPELYRKCRPIVIGDAACMQYALETAERIGVVKKGTLAVHLVHSVDEALFTFGSIDVYDLGIVTDISDRKFGIACPLGGEAAFQYVKKVIELAMEGQVDATVTNALSKEAINMAGHHFSGHTEIYAHFTGTEKYTMMLAHENLRVVHVSTHVSLREACDRVKKDRVLDCIRIANDGCRSLGIQSPKVAVAGLNPHCGEDGLFGREEIDEIQPAINAALAEGICIPDGKPTPADTVFSKAIGGWYDIVLRILLFAAATAAAGRGAFRMFFTRLQAKRTVGGYLKQLDDGYLGPHHLYTAGPSLLCRYGTQTKSVSGSAIQSIIPLKSCAALVADGVIFDAIPIQVVQETHLDDLLLRFAADCQRQELAELAEKLRHDLEKEAPIQQVFSWPDDAATLERQVTGHRLYYTTVRAWRGGTLIRLLIGLYGLGVLLLGGNIYLGAGFFLLGYFLSRQFLLCFTPAVRRITATALGQASQDAQCTLFVQAEKLTLLQRGSVLTMEKPTFAAKRASRTALCLYGTNAEMLTLPRELADETNMQKFFS